MYKFERHSLNIWDSIFMQNAKIGIKGRLLYLYLLTCPLSNIAGIFQISNKRLMEDLSLTKEELITLFGLLKSLKKAYRIGSYVIIKDAPHYSKKKTKTHIKEMNNIIDVLPSCIKQILVKIHYPFSINASMDKESIIKKEKKIITNKPSPLSFKEASTEREKKEIIEVKEIEEESTNKEGIIKNIETEASKTNSINNNASTALPDVEEFARSAKEMYEREEREAVSKEVLEGFNFVKASEIKSDRKEEKENNIVSEKSEEVMHVYIDADKGKKKKKRYEFGDDYEVVEYPINRIDREDASRSAGFNEVQILAKEVFYQFQKRRFYSFIDFEEFYNKEFLIGLESLKKLGINGETKEGKIAILKALRNYFLILKYQDEKITWWSSRVMFAKFCQHGIWKMFENENFNPKTFFKDKPTKREMEKMTNINITGPLNQEYYSNDMAI